MQRRNAHSLFPLTRCFRGFSSTFTPPDSRTVQIKWGQIQMRTEPRTFSVNEPGGPNRLLSADTAIGRNIPGKKGNKQNPLHSRFLTRHRDPAAGSAPSSVLCCCSGFGSGIRSQRTSGGSMRAAQAASA
ncbi:hypothetical protein GOODEAATRI_024654 [Goodea atripinnis]|uniref:Uncharacterized protein n=1 Tax=Goodea atripinnis TaxID=208336 RepID=A0ABV0Q0S3_9TELE